MTTSRPIDPSDVRAEFVVLANRVPVDRVVQPDGSSTWRRSPGGLVYLFPVIVTQIAPKGKMKNKVGG